MTTSFKTNTHEPLYRAGLSALAILTTLMFGAVAFAQDCETDADCDEGQTCEVVAVGDCACPPCPQGEECTCDCGAPEEYSECVTPPLTCDADSDCPGGLTCLNDGGGTNDAPCLVDEDGNTDCGGNEDPRPEPDGPGYCEFIPDDCDSDADCAEGFECQLSTSPCAGLCDPNGNCEDTCDDVEETGYCEPQQIECEADSDCPSSWTCYAFESVSCSGGGSTGSGCVCPGCAGEDCPPCECDDEPDEPIVEPDECTSEVENYCLPEGWDEWVESGGGGGGGVATNEDRENGGGGTGTGAPDDPNDDGQDGDVFNGEGGDGDDDDDNERANDGCAVSSPSNFAGGAGGALVALMALGLGVVVARRRR